MHRITFLFLIVFLYFIKAHSQEKEDFEKYRKVATGGKLSAYIDTLTNDSLLYNYALSQKTLKSPQGVVLKQGIFFGGMGSICGCESKPHGHWIYRYRNGKIKSSGEYRCNRKIGTWTSFYENGNIEKIESFKLAYEDFQKSFNFDFELKTDMILPYGLYAEYFENGNLKTHGTYDIIEEYSNTDTLYTFNEETYEEIKTVIRGDFWVPISVKTGPWQERDLNGKLIYNKEYSFYSIKENQRWLVSRYIEIFENITIDNKK